MRKSLLFALIAVLCGHGFVQAQTDVLMQHNDLGRTGWNKTETILNTTNVNNSTFGKVCAYAVDDQVYAQPLIVTGANIGGQSKNIVLIATCNNSIYCFDADDTAGGGHMYWTQNFTQSPALPSNGFNYRPPNNNDMFPDLCNGQYKDIRGNFGILGTPVVDKVAGYLYFVSRSLSGKPGDIDDHQYNSGSSLSKDYTNTGFYQVLHAIRLSDGSEVVGVNSPKLISASSAGTGDGSSGGILHLDPRRNNQRPGLVLNGGMLYIAYSSHCDMDPYHGWVIGYHADNFNNGSVGGDAPMAYVTTPNDGRGGIWMSGSAPAVDGSGELYVTSGNASTYKDAGNHDQSADPSITANRGESLIKIGPNAARTGFTLDDWFTSSNYNSLNAQDLDMPIQVMLIPNSNLLVTGIKDGNLYVFNKQTGLGHFNAASNQNLQTIGTNQFANMHSSFAYYEGSAAKYFYQMSENTSLKAYPIGSNSLGTAIDGAVNNPVGGSGGFMSVSSNGSDDNTGILWITQAIPYCDAIQSICPGMLRAVKASDVTKELWNSSYEGNYPGIFAKMSCPTVANGKVYIPSVSKQVVVYGLKAPGSCGTTNLALNRPATSSSNLSGNDNQGHPIAPASAFDGDFTSTTWQSKNDNNDEYLQVDLQNVYQICQVYLYWQDVNVSASKYTIDVSSDGTTWTNGVVTETNNTTVNHIYSLPNLSARFVRLHCTLRNHDQNGFNYGLYEMSVYGQPIAGQCAAPAGLSTTNIDQSSALLTWGSVPGVTSYHVQYRNSRNGSFVDTVTHLTSWQLKSPLTNLNCGSDYYWQVQANCTSTIQSDFAAATFSTTPCFGTCFLKTRYFATDLGATGVSGSSCLADPIWTIQGSGTDIAGTADAFQYAYTSSSIDETVTIRVLSQDNSTQTNKAGLMMRNALSPTSAFAMVGRTANNTQLFFEYRAVDGGPTVVSQTVTVGASIKPYIRLTKVGTVYAAFYSIDNGTTYSPIGSQNLNFGGGGSAFYFGFAVTSTNNGLLSTATFDQLTEGTTPLPVTLVNFSGTNVNNEYVALKWSTEQEVNNDYFSVEKSSDGSSFTSFTTVKGVGNSSVLQNYTANDDHPNQGVNFYRLKQVDLDGKFAYSPVIQVNFGKGYAPVVFPNPATSFFNILAGEETVKEISVYNVQGKEMYRLANGNGTTSFTIPVSNFASGVYIVKIKTATQVYQHKLLKE